MRGMPSFGLVVAHIVVCCRLYVARWMPRTHPRSAAAAELQCSEPVILQELLPTDATVTKVKHHGLHTKRP